MESRDVVIIGGGAAGYFAAAAAKEQNAGVSVLLLSGEDRIPYKRTKISKNIAVGYGRDQFAFQPEEAYREQGIELRFGTTAVRILPARHELELSDGGSIRWSKLILATGADPILPELPDGPAGLIVVRSAEQVDRLIGAASGCRSCAVIGMGVMGVEVAEQLVRAGKRVVLIGRSTELMPRELDEHASGVMDRLFREHGVELRYGRDVIGLERTDAGSIRLRLSSSTGTREAASETPPESPGAEIVEADLAVSCIGIRPRTDLAAAAGLEVGRGIRVDKFLRTSHPDIYAAGDAAEHPGGLVTHLWHAAEMQGRIAGRNAAGGNERYEHPGFRLKTELWDRYFFSMNKPPVLDSPGYEQDERIDDDRYLRFYYRDGSLDAVVMIGDPDRAKQYERAVREHWPREKVEAEFLA